MKSGRSGGGWCSRDENGDFFWRTAPRSLPVVPRFSDLLQRIDELRRFLPVVKTGAKKGEMVPPCTRSIRISFHLWEEEKRADDDQRDEHSGRLPGTLCERMAGGLGVEPR